MPRPWLVPLAVVLGIAGLSVTVVGLLVWAGLGFERLPTNIAQIPMLTAVLYVGTGSLLAARVPGNPVGWVFLAAGLILTPVLPLELLVAESYQVLRPAPSHTTLFAWLQSSFGTPLFIGLLAIGGLLFPDGRFLSTRWRSLAWLTAVAAVTLGFSVGLDPSGLVWYPTLANPFRAPASVEPVLVTVRAISLAVLVSSFVGVFAAQWIRYRLGDAVTRAQLRWVMYAVILEVIVVVPFVLTLYVLTLHESVRGAMVILAQGALVLLPLAATMAITRYHLFGIDTLIGRSQVYVPLMGALGGLYAIAVLVFQRVFEALTGGSSDLAFLLAVFLIAAAFTPLRKALEGAVDRWARPVGAAAAVAPEAKEGVTSTGTGPEDEAIRETAARLIALRRFEERLTQADAVAEPAGVVRLDIDGEGRVSCPLGQPTPFMACLSCPRLLRIQTSPPAVECAVLT